MELVNVLVVLARHRLALAAGVIVALAIALAVSGALPAGPKLAGTTTHSGIAESQVLVDTHTPYAGDLHGGTEVLVSQAALLAELVADEAQVAAIARNAAIAPDKLEVITAKITEPQVLSPLARGVAKVVDKPSRPYALTIDANSTVSIIRLEATAPTAAAAARLAQAATTTLESMTVAFAPSPARSLVIKPLGAVRSLTLTSGGRSGPLLGIAAAIAVFGLWSCAIVLLSGLRRMWRNAGDARAAARTATLRI